ncbi:MAG TPA: hypothetical protein VLJ44_12960 [Gaiellaceae bacterium]|nr:hypothetical protein [Gaiellaceae bacterium]
MRPQLRRVQDFGTGRRGAIVDGVDLAPRLDREGEVMEAGRVELELLVDAE